MAAEVGAAGPPEPSGERPAPDADELRSSFPRSVLFSSFANPKTGFPGYCASTRPDWTAACAERWPGQRYEAYAPFRDGKLRPENVAGKGRGLVSGTRAAKGEPLCPGQRPLALHHYEDSRRICEVCAQCGAWVGSLRSVLAKPLAEAVGAPSPEELVDDPADLAELEAGEWALNERIECQDGCGVVFCSAPCVAAARAGGWHRTLCTDLPPEKRRLWALFRQQAVRHHELFILAAKVIAEIVCLVRHYDAELWEAMAFFTRFAKMSWLSMLSLPSRSHTQGFPQRGKLEKLARQRRERRLQAVTNAVELLVAMMWERRFAELLTVDFFANLVGQFSLSNLWVQLDNPLSLKLAQRAGSDPEFKRRFGRLVDESAKAARKVSPPEEEEPGEATAAAAADSAQRWRLPRFEGSGLYVCCALSNHSCRPNFTMKLADDATATMTALRDVADGDELHLSYVSPSCDLEERLARLWRVWGFVCTCSKCQEEMMARALERQKGAGELLTPAGVAAARSLEPGGAASGPGSASDAPPFRPPGRARAPEPEQAKAEGSGSEEDSEEDENGSEGSEEEEEEEEEDSEADIGFEEISWLSQRPYANLVGPQGVAPSVSAIEAGLKALLASAQEPPQEPPK